MKNSVLIIAEQLNLGAWVRG